MPRVLPGDPSRDASRGLPRVVPAVSPRAPARRNLARPGREQRVGDILDAAMAVFTERGFDAATMAEIAARCSIVEGTLYKYFDSKRELLHSVLVNWYEQLFGDFSRDLPGIVGSRAQLRYLVWRHLRNIDDNPLLSRLMFMHVRSQPDYLGSALHAMNQRYTTMLTGVLRQGMDNGEIHAAVNPSTVRDLIYGGIEHLSWRRLAGAGELDVDARADELIALVWNGLAATVQPVPAKRVAPLDRQIERLAKIADRLELATNTKRTSQR